MLQIKNSNEIWANVYMRATETRADWTTAEGEAPPYRVYTSTTPIQYIIGRTVGEHFYMDDDHALDVFEFPAGQNIIRRAEFVGDTRGDKAGTRTGVRIALHPVDLMVS